MTRKLTLDDIADLRQYERERDDFRRRVIALKKRRRVGIGPFVTVVFENRDTIRFQIQEMARVERLLSDEAIETELKIYNPLVPEPGHLALTLFVELTSEAELREWLPKLVGIERSVRLEIGTGEGARSIPAVLDADHESTLTREEVTASVHYLHFSLDPAEVDAVAAGPVHLVVDHPAYGHSVELGADTVEELLRDLRPDGSESHEE